MSTHPTGTLFRRLYFGAQGVLSVSAQIFTHSTSPLHCISNRTWAPGGLKLGSAPYFLGSFCFTRLCNLSQDLRTPPADRRETLPHYHYIGALYNACPKILGLSPKKIWWPNTSKNLTRFYTTSKFDRKYLWNETRYQKSERHVIENDSSIVQRNKSGELWSTIHKVVHVSLDPPKSPFLTDCIWDP